MNGGLNSALTDEELRTPSFMLQARGRTKISFPGSVIAEVVKQLEEGGKNRYEISKTVHTTCTGTFRPARAGRSISDVACLRSSAH